jgi:formylmethanofuran:tetrahydromethanopterin formyltransferase
MGQFVTEGMANGIEDKKSEVLDAMNSVSSLITSVKMGASSSTSNTYNTYSSSSPSNSINIKSLVTIEGNVDDSSMPKVQKAVKDGIKELENALKMTGANTQLRMVTI